MKIGSRNGWFAAATTVVVEKKVQLGSHIMFKKLSCEVKHVTQLPLLEAVVVLKSL